MHFSSIKWVAFLLLLTSRLLISQEKILEFNTQYSDTYFSLENSFTMVDEISNDFTVFLTKKSNIVAFHYNSLLEAKGRLLSTQLPNKYKVPLGGTIEKGRYTLFYTTNDKDQFSGISFDFEKRWSNVFELDFKLKKEIYLTHFVFKNTFYIIAASYRTSHLFLYSFDTSGNHKKEIIDLTSYELYGGQSYPTRLKSTVGLDLPNREITNVFWVQQGIPYSLDSMVSLVKLYISGNQLFLVSDLNRSFTQIISYDLEKAFVDYKRIEHPIINKDDGVVNSYMLDDKLFQLKINSKELALRATNISSQEILKEYRVTEKDSTFFSNRKMKQRGGRYKKYRELEKISQFLRKVGTSNPAIYVEKREFGYSLSLGSVEEIDNGALYALAMVNPFVPFALIGNVTLYFNPVALAFYRSSNTRAVYVSQSLNRAFEPIEEIPNENVFYRINDYLRLNDIKRFTAADIFTYDNSFIFGMLDKKTRRYSLRRFD